MGPIQNFHELISWMRRRWRVMALLLLIGGLSGLIMAMRTGRIYSSSAVIQVVNPVIAVGDDASGAVNPDVTRRVQIIEQRLMSRESLLALAARHGLFDGMAVSPSEQVARMRQSFSITSIAAAQQGFSRDGSLSALIISASNDRPEVAAAIANELADAVVSESSSGRQANAQQAVAFFRQEESRLAQSIAALEAQIAAYRTENESVLPESVTLRRAEQERLSGARLQIEQEVGARQSELDTLDPRSPRAITQRRFAQLTSELAQFAQQSAVLDARLAAVQDLLQRAPEVEQQILATDRQMTQLQAQLTNAAERRREAELGLRLADDDQSERFVLLERALVPEYPISRSRRTVALMGLVGGLLAGVLLAYALEWLQPVLRTGQRMERELHLRPVISIPLAPLAHERRRRRMVWALGLLVLLAALGGAGALIGLF